MFICNIATPEELPKTLTICGHSDCKRVYIMDEGISAYGYFMNAEQLFVGYPPFCSYACFLDALVPEGEC